MQNVVNIRAPRTSGTDANSESCTTRDVNQAKYMALSVRAADEVAQLGVGSLSLELSAPGVQALLGVLFASEAGLGEAAKIVNAHRIAPMHPAFTGGAAVAAAERVPVYALARELDAASAEMVVTYGGVRCRLNDRGASMMLALATASADKLALATEALRSHHAREPLIQG